MTNAPNNIGDVYEDQVLVNKDKVMRELHDLEPSSIIELFQLRLTQEVNGGDVRYYYYDGTNELSEDIVFNNVGYSPAPVEASGFDATTKGTLPRPRLKIANVDHAVSRILQVYNPLRAEVRRIRTCVRFLDDVNFADGSNPNADPDAIIGGGAEVWYIDRVVAENPQVVEFELVGSLDLTNLRLPGRQVVEHCPWLYRGHHCGYKGGKKFDLKNKPTSNADEDQCAKNLKACELRFPKGKGNGRLPFGGFPGARLQV
jgi:lambda family phage minor tail protein L